MKLKLILLLPAVLMSACISNTNFTPEQSLSIRYMQTANALSDAKVAIANNNFTLIGYDQRGLIVPGLSSTKINSLKKACTIKRIDGLGDVVRSPKELERRINVRRYSKTYNEAILKTTSCD